jgi:hypothetical protein
MPRVSRNARGDGIRDPRGGGFQMGRLYMVSVWAVAERERLPAAAAGVVAAGRGSGGAEREEKEESTKKRAETANPPSTAP